MSANDGAESVDQFLARIAATPQGRDEDTRRVDEEFLKGRQERQARRLERARSISPSKTGPVSSLSLQRDISSHSTTKKALSPPIEFSPGLGTLVRSNAVSGRTSPSRNLDNMPLERSPSPSVAGAGSVGQHTAPGLARSGTLSWQQRPTSRDGARERPPSAVASARPVPKPPTEDKTPQEPTTKDIAASLAQKDPAWFRQTQDRGRNSAAYRKNQVEDTPEGPISRTMQLPGLAQSRELSNSPVPQDRVMQEETDRFKRGTTPDIVALRNSMAEKPTRPRSESRETAAAAAAAARSQPADQDAGDNRSFDLGRASTVLSQNRSPSPTKGLGGFVESAMMKRSDSVNKRWSVKANPGLKRGDSVLGGRPPALHSRGFSKDLPQTRADSPSSPLASPRPGSSHVREKVKSPDPPEINASPILSDSVETAQQDTTQDSSHLRRSPQLNDRPETPVEDAKLPRSPSKTMDPRRWSPTKSTWLESALQHKPEPQKMQLMKDEVPKWRLDLQRSKSQRASRDVSPSKAPATVEVAASADPVQSSSPTKLAQSSRTTGPAFPGWSSSPTTLPKAVSSAAAIATKDDAVPDQTPASDDNTRKSSPAPTAVMPSEEAASPSKIEDLTKKAPLVKPKPQTPPQTDFRAALKNRNQAPTANTSDEPEFKAMFGKLKRTTTQNYVAPDELKNNILSGKAALSVTGGPVKTKRVDEFKESILAKKEEMKSAPSKSQSRPEMKPKPETPIPEALARRKTLSKGSTPANSASRTKEQAASASRPAITPTPDPLAVSSEFVKPIVERSSASGAATAGVATSKMESQIGAGHSRMGNDIVNMESKAPTTGRPAVGADGKLTVSKPEPAPKFTPSDKPVRLRTGPPAETDSDAKATTPSSNLLPVSGGLPPGSKLASRLNPNLAALLSRGGSPRPQSSPNASTEDVSTRQPAETSTASKNEDPASLVHMTKGRAKGPKRRAPKVEGTTEADSAKKQPTTSVVDKSKSLPRTPKVKPSIASKTTPMAASHLPSEPDAKSQTTIPGLKQPEEAKAARAQFLNDPARSSPKNKPVVASKSPDLRRVSSSVQNKEETGKPPSKPSTPRKPSWSPPRQSPLTLTAKDEGKQAREFVAEPTTSAISPLPSSPLHQNRHMASSETSPQSAEKPAPRGLGLKMTPSPTAKQVGLKPRVLTPPPESTATGERVDAQQMRQVIESYTGVLPKEHDKADFDAQHFLKSMKQTDAKIKVESHSISEITGDGRKSAPPPQLEHILYEESMYLITAKLCHEDGATTSEVYLWCGDRVSDASIEDAQIFCKRDAREQNAKLEIVRQGKESASLIQALGGILIIRRSKSSSTYMLCGRRHLGHIVFDEVDMESACLCPGFAYLIAAQQGKLYLWKGKGASADEIGSARLIGMDLGLTVEIEEIAQGSEPPAFWQCVGSNGKAAWVDDWHQRGAMGGFPTALYRVEHERPGMLTNLASWGLKRAASPSKPASKATCERIQPFSQADLDVSAIHIIDAYRTFYVVLTPQCGSKASEFVSSLYLAQDLAMLSPAVQDRPVLPSCYVVAGTLPDDVKACFRKWNDGRQTSLASRESLCVNLERVMEALEL